MHDQRQSNVSKFGHIWVKGQCQPGAEVELGTVMPYQTVAWNKL